MDPLRRCLRWVEDNRDLMFELVRIYLGIGLFFMGIEFLQDTSRLLDAMSATGERGFRFGFVSTFMAHYIPIAHLGGGLLLAAGLLTRVSAAFQIPILIGAAFVVHRPGGLFGYSQEFKFAALVLFLLVLILIHGGGRLSVDHYLKQR
ncbi:MAG TPA: DoxX family membrane protein [Candidatus Polarisedimenticolaceae bacterium]|nr:DoxX family membrane protein [Candidatus Polarisedimenticolaceae bacterium]